MLSEYINYQSILSNVFFEGFKVVIITLTIFLIISLILLALGCLIKSQKLKTKFLKTVPSLLLIIFLLLALPLSLVHFKNLFNI